MIWVLLLRRIEKIGKIPSPMICNINIFKILGFFLIFGEKQGRLTNAQKEKKIKIMPKKLSRHHLILEKGGAPEHSCFSPTSRCS